MRNLIILLLLALLPTQANAEWLRAETARFVVHADTDAATIERAARDLEILHAALSTMTGLSNEKPLPTKLQFYLLENIGAIRKLVKMPEGAGAYFMSTPAEDIAVAAFNDEESAENGIPYDYRWPLYHEYAHYFMRRNLPRAQPSWYVEGWASLVETAEISPDGRVRIGKQPVFGEWIRREPTWANVKDVLQSDAQQIKPEFMSHFYAEGWLLAHMLHVGKQRESEFSRYFSLIHNEAPLPEIDTLFEGKVDALYRDMRTYAKDGKFDPIDVTMPPLPESAPAIRALRPGEVALIDNRIKWSRLDDFKALDEIVATSLPIGEKYGDDGEVAEFVANVAYQAEKFAVAEKLVNRLIAAGNKSPRLQALRGLLTMRRALDAPAERFNGLLAKSRAEISLALTASPNDPIILTAMFRNHEAADGPVPKASFSLLWKAIDNAAANADLRFWLAEKLIQQGDYAGALRAVEPMANSPHRNEIWAKAAGYASALKKMQRKPWTRCDRAFQTGAILCRAIMRARLAFLLRI